MRFFRALLLLLALEFLAAAQVQVAAAVTATVIISSSPMTGEGFVRVGGADVTTPYKISLSPNANLWVEAVSPVSCGEGCRWIWDSWSDGGTQKHLITIPASNNTLYVAFFKKQWRLAVVGGDDSTLGYNDGVWVNEGEFASSSTRYVFNEVVVGGTPKSRGNVIGYSIDAQPPRWFSQRTSSGIATTESIRMAAPHKVSWLSVNQYYLEVRGGGNITYTTPSPTGDLGWYDERQTTAVGSDGVFNTIKNSRQRVVSWNVDAGASRSVRPTNGRIITDSIAMDGPHTVSFTSVRQFLLTINGGNNIRVSEPPPIPEDRGWFDEGAAIFVETQNVWSVVEGHSRSRIVSWRIDDGNSTRVSSEGTTTVQVTMGSPHTLTFESKTQYFLNVVGGYQVRFSVAPPTGTRGWYDEGTIVGVTTEAIFDIVTGRTRTRISYWVLDDGPRINVTTTENITVSNIGMHKPRKLSFAPVTQFAISVATSVPGTRVSISDSPTGDGWYDQGSTIAFGAQSPYEPDKNRHRFVFVAWTGLFESDSSRTEYKVASFGTATATWKEQWYISVTTPYGNPALTTGYYDAGADHTVLVTSPFVQVNRFVVLGFRVDDSPLQAGSRYTFRDLSGPRSITFAWAPDKVVLAEAPKNRVDVGTTQFVRVLLKWESDSVPVDGFRVSINGTEFLARDGLVSLNYSQARVGRISWRITQANGGENFVNKVVPEIIFDRVAIGLSAERNRIDVGRAAPITWRALYEYDQTPFSGRVHLNDTLVHAVIGKYYYTVAAIEDPLYSLKSFNSDTIWVVFDRVELTLSAPERVQVATNVTVKWIGRYLFDNVTFAGGIKLSDATTKTEIGRFAYAVTEITDRRYGLSVFTSNTVPVIFDRLRVEYHTRALLLGQIVVNVRVTLAYDQNPVDGADVRVNGLRAKGLGDGVYEVELRSFKPTENMSIFTLREPFHPIEIGDIVYSTVNIGLGLMGQLLIGGFVGSVYLWWKGYWSRESRQ